MDVEFKIIGREDVPHNERRTVNVETHQSRGDVYNVLKVDTVLEGDTVMFRVPDGGRLLISVPDTENDIVYDPAQGAAIRKSAQTNDQNRADDARLGEAHEPDARQRVREEVVTPPGVRPPQGMAPQPGTVNDPNMNPNINPNLNPNVNPAANAPRRFVQTTPSPSAAEKARADAAAKAKDDADPKVQAEREAKAQQQSGAGRPPGESPPLPGSPVGSPPHGNEGKK